MIFPEEYGIDCSYEERYETKEEAINDHNRIVYDLKNGKYTITREQEKYRNSIYFLKRGSYQKTKSYNI